MFLQKHCHCEPVVIPHYFDRCATVETAANLALQKQRRAQHIPCTLFTQNMRWSHILHYIKWEVGDKAGFTYATHWCKNAILKSLYCCFKTLSLYCNVFDWMKTSHNRRSKKFKMLSSNNIKSQSPLVIVKTIPQPVLCK